MRSDATPKNFSTKKDTNSKQLGSYKPPKKCGRENFIDKEMEDKTSLLRDFFEFRSKFSRCSKLSSFAVVRKLKKLVGLVEYCTRLLRNWSS